MRVTWLALVVGLVGCALSRDGLFETEGEGEGGQSSVQTGVGAATSTTTTTSTASTGAGGSENCLDGVDNDGNDLIDCADEACTPGFECVPPAPTGWQHHRLLTGGYGAVSTVPCPDDSAPATSYSEEGGPASCTSCECGGVQGVTCSAAQLLCWTGTSCSGGADFLNASASGCVDGTINNSYGRCAIGTQPQASGGNCPPSGGVATVPPPFGFHHDACPIAQVGGGCENDEVCVPLGEAPYDAPVCIAQPGAANNCPAGWSDLVVSYGAFADDRGCETCGCSLSGVSCSGASFTIYDLDGCSTGGDGTATVSGNSCVDVSQLLDNGFGSIGYTAPSPSGNCTAQGGSVIGGVNPSMPTSYCCQ